MMGMTPLRHFCGWLRFCRRNPSKSLTRGTSCVCLVLIGKTPDERGNIQYAVTHAPGAAERFPGYHSLPQPIVHDSLMAKIKSSPLVELRLGCELRRVALLGRQHLPRGEPLLEMVDRHRRDGSD